MLCFCNMSRSCCSVKLSVAYIVFRCGSGQFPRMSCACDASKLVLYRTRNRHDELIRDFNLCAPHDDSYKRYNTYVFSDVWRVFTDFKKGLPMSFRANIFMFVPQLYDIALILFGMNANRPDEGIRRRSTLYLDVFWSSSKLGYKMLLSIQICKYHSFFVQLTVAAFIYYVAIFIIYPHFRLHEF
jgi:hypothetical protein